MPINFGNSRRELGWDDTLEAGAQTQVMLDALYEPGTPIEFHARVGRLQSFTSTVAAADGGKWAVQAYEKDSRRDVDLSFDIVPAKEFVPGRGPTTSVLPLDVPVLAVTFVDRRPDLIEKLQYLSVPPNVMVDAGPELDGAWRLNELIDRHDYDRLGEAIAALLGVGRKDGYRPEMLVPGFPTPRRQGTTSKLLEPVHGDTCSLSALRAMCAPYIKAS